MSETTEKTPWFRANGLIFVFGLTVFVLYIAAQIEWLNAEAGGKLPNREYRNNDPAQGVVKWRQSPFLNESSYRSAFGPQAEKGESAEGPLTEVEQLRMEKMIRQGKANNRLRGFVEMPGLLQYLLVPALFIAGVNCRKSRGWKFAIVPVVVALVAGALMFYRSYFSSLGW